MISCEKKILIIQVMKNQQFLQQLLFFIPQFFDKIASKLLKVQLHILFYS